MQTTHDKQRIPQGATADSDDDNSLASPREGELPARMTQRESRVRAPAASKNRLAAWRKLTTRKGREAAGMMIVEGERLVTDTVSAGVTIESIILAGDRALPQSVKTGLPTVRVTESEFRKLAGTMHPSGVAAVVRWQPTRYDGDPPLPSRARHLLYCDRISDPGNMGTLLRAAAGLGIDAVFVHPRAVELTNPKTVRAGAGALFRVPIFIEAEPSQVADWCRRREVAILVADAHRGEPPGPAPSQWLLVVGGETLSLDPVWARAGVQYLSIPLQHGVESLNAGVAGALLIDRLSRKPRGG